MSRRSSQNDSSQFSSPPEASDQELDQTYPNRPINHSPALPFHTLFTDLFSPLHKNRNAPKSNKNQPTTRRGPHAGLSAAEVRRGIIQSYISRWRKDVGDDFHPALRLILPEKDRERAMYGIKEKALGRYLVKIMKIDRHSEDAQNLLNWKLPGQKNSSKSAGDFPARCFEVISKRPILTDVGNLTIDEVNQRLDKLAGSAKEEVQLPIMNQFYQQMNAEELMWLIRIILRQMKVGATEKTILRAWHPDAEVLFNVSSSLRRVCWDLHSPSIRLEGQERGVAIMECFQPQLAQYQSPDFKQLIAKFKPTEDDNEFWIEEKMDGERMQLHMITEGEGKDRRRVFRYWSRKAKEYTYLYGNGGDGPEGRGALTHHIQQAFQHGVENIILDGEMITWDPEEDIMVAFGSLKSAALAQQADPYSKGQRPLFRVFDILYLNDTPLTLYTLRDRRRALERSVKSVHRRLELQEYAIGTKPEDIEPHLHSIIQRASEGLVIKNPRSAYRLNERNDDWIKVKPEYMDEHGEHLDCVVIGGYYGSGHRGGNVSSFLCGLRMDKSYTTKDNWRPQKFTSFCKVGGGLNADDFATIRHLTDGKWIPYDAKKPPTDYIELGGGVQFQRERPDVWIKPENSFVIEVKASEVTPSDEFGFGSTLRFPRFKRLRQDKNWETALSTGEFLELRKQLEEAKREGTGKKLKPDDSRKKRRKVESQKRFVTVMGYDAREVNAAEVAAARTASQSEPGNVFQGLTFYIMTEAVKPVKKTKLEIEEMVKLNGGSIVQTDTMPVPKPKPQPKSKTKGKPDPSPEPEEPETLPAPQPVIICIADRRTVKVASLEKRNTHEILRPIWLTDCIEQARRDVSRGLQTELVIPIEPDRHVYFLPSPDPEEDSDGETTTNQKQLIYTQNVDPYGDSYARDVSADDLRVIVNAMTNLKIKPHDPNTKSTRTQLLTTLQSLNTEDPPGWIFHSVKAHLLNYRSESIDHRLLKTKVLFAGAESVTTSSSIEEISDTILEEVTHIIALDSLERDEKREKKDADSIRKRIVQMMKNRKKGKVPRIIAEMWIRDSWDVGSRVDEERYVVS